MTPVLLQGTVWGYAALCDSSSLYSCQIHVPVKALKAFKGKVLVAFSINRVSAPQHYVYLNYLNCPFHSTLSQTSPCFYVSAVKVF